MPEQDISHAELSRQLGRLEGELHSVKGEMRGVKDVQGKIFDKLELLHGNVEVMRSEVTSAKVSANKACEIGEDIMTKPHPTPALIKTKPWEKPIGDLMGDIFIQALKIIGIGIVIALILYGMGNGNFNA